MKKVCVVTGTRAEYGLLYWLMKEIQHHANMELFIIVTGSHLVEEFGLTYHNIEADGFIINKKIHLVPLDDSPYHIAKAVGLGTTLFSEAYDEIKPDLVVLLGDRYELLSAVQSAMLMQIPIAHIHGGEITEGAIDELIRHAVSKMSHIHFVAAEEYRTRLIHMGEQPSRVFNVGSLGVEGIQRIPLLNKQMLAEQLGINNLNKYFLVTLHPTTLDRKPAHEQLSQLLRALEQFPQYKVIFTKANADTDGRLINQMLANYVNEQSERCYLFDSLGQLKYLSSVKYASAVIGNSSSGILEAPALSIPTVNIGVRQKGRLRTSSILDCDFNVDDIVDTINKALDQTFKDMLVKQKLAYTSEATSKKIVSKINELDIEDLLTKPFYDIN